MQSCQDFNQKFLVFGIQIDIVQEQKMLQKQKIPQLKAQIYEYHDFEGNLCSF